MVIMWTRSTNNTLDKKTPSVDETTGYQSVIHWSEKYYASEPRPHSPNNKSLAVPITCRCGTRFEIFVTLMRLSKNPRLPLCRNCSILVSRRRGSNHPDWEGGRVIKEGYIHIHINSLPAHEQEKFSSMVIGTGYIPEHRLAVARSLDRPLARNEHVHHINANKQDNRPKNLKLLSPQEHPKQELSWARKEIKRLRSILDRYDIDY